MSFINSFFVSSALLCTSLSAHVPKWTKQEWDALYAKPLLLPHLCGAAIAEYQVSGADNCPQSNWAAWEVKGTHNGHPTIKNNDRSGSGSDFWHKWRDSIDHLKELGCNSFRFSVEWSVIEPEEGVFCPEALQHYADLCDALIEAGIIPMITLHHFTHPQWFEDRGGFAVEANIPLFVRFCEHVFTKLSSKVSLWCTINEIGPFVFEGYVEGVFPPGKFLALHEAAVVMRTMLKAHCDVYRALKALPGGDRAQIGLVHQYAPFEAHSSLFSSMSKAARGYAAMIALSGYIGASSYGLNPRVLSSLTFAKYCGVGVAAFAGLNILEQVPARFMHYLFNDAMLNFLKTGVLFPYIPLLRMTITDAPDCYDFIGLNVYSRMVMRSRVCDAVLGKPAPDSEFPIVYPTGRDGELKTDMPYVICPESLYAGIVEMSKLGKPIYITENGAPDKHGAYRGLYIKSYLTALSRALYDGYDVRGFYYWSLMKNFEWNRGYEQNFGLYEVDPQTYEWTLCPGAEVYQAALSTGIHCF
jgi:beta-glucosidase